jgi:hypothetical protein
MNKNGTIGAWWNITDFVIQFAQNVYRFPTFCYFSNNMIHYMLLELAIVTLITVGYCVAI